MNLKTHDYLNLVTVPGVKRNWKEVKHFGIFFPLCLLNYFQGGGDIPGRKISLSQKLKLHYVYHSIIPGPST